MTDPAAMLDAHVPGWRAMTPIAFRWAVGELDAALRPALRAAWAAAPPVAAAPTPSPEPVRARRAGKTATIASTGYSEPPNRQ